MATDSALRDAVPHVAAGYLRAHGFLQGTLAVIRTATGPIAELEVRVVLHLAVHPPARPRELMAVTGLSRPSVASLVARLERDGIVARSFGRDDRRTTLTSLTRKYRRRLDGLDEDLATYFTDSAPVVDEVLDLLRDDDPGTEGPVPEQSAPALAAASRLVEAMAGCAGRLETVVPELGARCHLALMALVAKGPARPAELSTVLGLSSGGMTYLGNQLEAEGLVERTYGLAEDRRAVSMALTPDGRRRAESLCAAVRESRTPLLMALATTRELAVPVA